MQASSKKGKCAHYLSIEFLIGRVFYNNLLELGVLEETAKILKKKGVDISVFEEIEDAALGNGGLGRLAACYLDSGAAVGVPLYGYGIRYKFGLFRQKFENGFQIEMPDDCSASAIRGAYAANTSGRSCNFADMDVEAGALRYADRGQARERTSPLSGGRGAKARKRSAAFSIPRTIPRRENFCASARNTSSPPRPSATS